jgi:hypothetical protein
MTDKKEAKNSWITNDSGRKQFWANVTAAGLDEDNAHEIFGVESMYDYPGTLAEAIATLKEWEANKPQDAALAPEASAPEAPGEPLHPQSDGLADRLAYRCQQLPESPAVAWTKFETPGGFVWSLTLRAGLQPDLARLALTQVREQIELFEKGAEVHKWLPVSDGRDVTALSVVPARAQPAPPAGAPAAPQQGSSGNGKKEGSDPLKKITVDADGRVQFYVGSFRYPFKDARGAETVAGLFDPALGWTAAHLQPGAKYEGDAVAGLVVDWEKPEKYYDVVLVHR